MIKRQKGTVILPIPDDIKDSNSVKWGGSSMGPIQAAAVPLLEQGYLIPKMLKNKFLPTEKKCWELLNQEQRKKY
jgi:hypothetical protein